MMVFWSVRDSGIFARKVFEKALTPACINFRLAIIFQPALIACGIPGNGYTLWEKLISRYVQLQTHPTTRLTFLDSAMNRCMKRPGIIKDTIVPVLVPTWLILPSVSGNRPGPL